MVKGKKNHCFHFKDTIDINLASYLPFHDFCIHCRTYLHFLATCLPFFRHILPQLQGFLAYLGGQQSEIDALNFLGQQIQESSNASIAKNVEEKLKAINKNWEVLKTKALTSERTQGPHLGMGNDNADGSPMAKNAVLRFPSIRARSPDSEDEEMDLIGSQQEAHLRYQLAYSELFDWLASVEGSIGSSSQDCRSLDVVMCRMQALQVGSCVC